LKVATHRDGSELDYNEANGLFSINDMVVTVQQVAKFDRARKLSWSTPENREWFRRLAQVDRVDPHKPRRRFGCLKVALLVGLIVSVLTCCTLAAVGRAIQEGSVTAPAASSPQLP